MPTRIRLQRKGKKNRPYYHIVIADSRSPRDGRYIERTGAYDPNQVPAFVELNFDRALSGTGRSAAQRHLQGYPELPRCPVHGPPDAG